MADLILRMEQNWLKTGKLSSYDTEGIVLIDELAFLKDPTEDERTERAKLLAEMKRLSGDLAKEAKIHGLQILIDTAFNPFSVQFFPEKTAQSAGQYTDEDMHGYSLVCPMENRTYGQKSCIFHLLE